MSAKIRIKTKKTRLKKDNIVNKYKIRQNSCKEIEARKEKETI